MHVGVRTEGERLAEIAYLPFFAYHGEGFHLEIKRWLLAHEKAI